MRQHYNNSQIMAKVVSLAMVSSAIVGTVFLGPILVVVVVGGCLFGCACIPGKKR